MHLILYISQTAFPADETSEVLKSIRRSCRRNKTNGVTGVLFCENGHFLQALEGEETALRETFDRISNDPRHKNIRVLIDEPISQRSFADWSMDTFFVQHPELVNARTISLLNQIYEQNFELNTRDLIDFHKQMIDQVDSFKILHFD